MKPIDLNTCVPGQKLLLRDGKQATYQSKNNLSGYPHNVYESGFGQAYYADSGKLLIWHESADDVVEIIPLTSALNGPVQKAKEDKLQILLKKRGTKYQFKVISQPESFRNPKNNDQICFRLGNGFEFYSCEYPAISDNGVSVYLRGDCHFKDNDSQLIVLTEEQVKVIRESVKLFNEEYGPSLVSGRPADSKVKIQTLEEITAEYQTAQIAALDNYRSKIQKLLTGSSF